MVNGEKKQIYVITISNILNLQVAKEYQTQSIKYLI